MVPNYKPLPGSKTLKKCIPLMKSTRLLQPVKQGCPSEKQNKIMSIKKTCGFISNTDQVGEGHGSSPFPPPPPSGFFFHCLRTARTFMLIFHEFFSLSSTILILVSQLFGSDQQFGCQNKIAKRIPKYPGLVTVKYHSTSTESTSYDALYGTWLIL